MLLRSRAALVRAGHIGSRSSSATQALRPAQTATAAPVSASMASFVTYTASKPRAAVLSRPITASSVSFTSSANTLVSTTASSYVTPASATAATKTPVATSQARHFASFGSNSSSAAGAAPKTRFWRREPPPSGTTRSDTGLNIPANSEGIPFRLSPDDCMEAYSKWFWRKTPFFRPIPPKSLTPVVLPFWAFTFTVTIRHKRSNTIRVIDYNMFDGDMGATHGIFADARMRASQVYAGYEFTREMVDILKAPANLAHPWSPAFLTPPEHNSLGIFAFRPPDYTSRFDPRRAAAFASAHMSQDNWKRARKVIGTVFGGSNVRSSHSSNGFSVNYRVNRYANDAATSFLDEESDKAAAAAAPGELFKGSKRTDEGMGLAYQEDSKPGLFWRGRRLVVKPDSNTDSDVRASRSWIERGALGAVGVLSRVLPMSTDKVRLVPATPLPLGDVQTDEFTMLEKTALLQAQAAVARTELTILQFGGQLASDGSLLKFPPLTKAAITEAAKLGQSLAPNDFKPDDYEITVESPLSRRLFLPGYKSVYSHMFSDWEVYTSAVTGRSFGLQQTGMLESLTRGATMATAWMTGAGFLGQSAVLFRFIPILSKISALFAGVYGLKAKLDVFRLRKSLQSEWAQTRSEEIKVRELLLSHSEERLNSAAEWLHRPGQTMAARLGTQGQQRWEELFKRDAKARQRQATVQEGLRHSRARAEAEAEAAAAAAAAEAAEEQRRSAQQQQQYAQQQQQQQYTYRQQQEQQRKAEEEAAAAAASRRREQERAARRAQEEAEKARKKKEQEARHRNKPPPEIPNDVYEVLGLPRPRTYNEARRITMAEIRNGYRTQLMKYHPDFYREDTAPYSVAYTQLRTQAIVEAHRLVKTEALKSAWDNDRYPK